MQLAICSLQVEKDFAQRQITLAIGPNIALRFIGPARNTLSACAAFQSASMYSTSSVLKQLQLLLTVPRKVRSTYSFLFCRDFTRETHWNLCCTLSFGYFQPRGNLSESCTYENGKCWTIIVAFEHSGISKRNPLEIWQRKRFKKLKT